MTEDKIKHALAIVDGTLALLCLALAARWVESWFAVIQIGIVVAGAVAAFVAVVFCLSSIQN
jgi:hypothetical protein